VTTFPIVVNPQCLTHLVQSSATCTDPVTIELVTRAVIASVGQLTEDELFDLVRKFIARRHNLTGLVATAADQAWREAEAAVRAALGFEPVEMAV